MARNLNSRGSANSRSELAAAFCVFLSGLVLSVTAAGLPDPGYEPVGPTAFPFWAGIALMILAVIMAVGGIAAHRTRTTSAPAVIGSFDVVAILRRYSLLTATVALTILYVGSMEIDLLGFRSATVVFTFTLFVLLARDRKRVVPVALIVALLLGIGLDAAFTRFFYIDLPG